jgi:hypothetical protein
MFLDEWMDVKAIVKIVWGNKKGKNKEKTFYCCLNGVSKTEIGLLKSAKSL